MSDRATAAVRGFYNAHLRECRDCRKMHRLLYALYEGPVVPPPPTGIAEEKEFHAALRRTREELPEPWYHKWSLRAGVTAMAGAAAALTLALFSPSTPDEIPGTSTSSVATNEVAPTDPAAAGGIDHPAQSYGRVLGGNAAVTTSGSTAGQPPANTDTFPVGTRFRVHDDDALQVGMVGKIVANFTPGSDIEWVQATPSLIELEVHRGIAAVRYDRRPSDPILYVRTPSAVVRVIGTVFTVEVDEHQETIVSVLRGQVDVLHPETNSLRAEVESGDRYEVSTSSHGNVGLTEVAAALPLSNEVDGDSADFTDALALADGHIPNSWNVPGLSDDPTHRTLINIPAPTAEPTTFEVPVTRRRPGATSPVEPAHEQQAAELVIDDETGDLIEHLMKDVKATRGKELNAALDACRNLYASQRTRYRAARCLSDFISQYGHEPAAVEGYLLVGMLRMDYALDYRAADKAFEEFLSRAPRNHPSAELAMYRLWLSATEDGRISEALTRGRRYLARFPNGKYVGKVLQRFDELKAEY
ncbi:FecR domain-containing protein [Paraliomyxa miuraensis]|uniref:FecR domain-containing protein n=1 Tax=Paraliomyxa miuraensis TaxID=376150 RepID=UPI002251E8AD|nr:FecR domain-containing protein [Paraliomyxa miuraensis]MCX4240258.1 FecR domain-containing protein [Paraliomyxa miuraensis]